MKHLSYDSDWSVREVIAERDNLDEDTVNRLAQDDNEYVREAIENRTTSN